MQIDLSGRRALVTGGGTGIGRQFTESLAAAGAHVVICGRRPEPLDQAAAEITAAGGAASAVVADVSREEDLQQLAATAGPVDVLVNNAGITGSQAAARCHETPVAEWDRVQAVNVRGPFLCSRAVLPSMIARGTGHIITIASIAGLVAFPGRCAYTASKGAALMLTRSIAVDYAAAGIRANAVCPGMVYTPMTSWRLDQPDLRAAVENRIPAGRVADPAEIADAVALLASGRLGYMTGHPLVLDGGMSAL
jgi:NAD(P)-dependent dehydrogenase (short-subunit alcohol dehydrogenase family)